MNSQQLADRLAELAGWTKDHDGWWTHPGKPYETTNTIVKVGSLDALERWRGEWLPEYKALSVYGPVMEGPPDEWTVYVWKKAGHQYGTGTTFWDAYAAALIAAKENKK